MVILFVAIFFIGLIVSTIVTGLSTFILSAYIALSLMTFAVYAVDKSAAKNGDYRVSEALLQWLALAGGWPGALLAQHFLRHKTKKKRFLYVFWAAVAVNCAFMIWLHTPLGRSFLGAA